MDVWEILEILSEIVDTVIFILDTVVFILTASLGISLQVCNIYD